MNTPFQHFITLAQRVFDNVSIDQPMSDLTKSISWISVNQTSSSLVFGKYPTTCKVHLIVLDEQTTQAHCEFSSPLNSDESEFDTLWIEWTWDVDQFLASDSMLLLDNQIKANLKK